MPELPEVETIARGLAQRITGDVIESIWLGQKPEPLKSPAHEMASVLEGSRIATVRRIGKHIVFNLQRENVARALLPAKATPRMQRATKVRPARASHTVLKKLGGPSPEHTQAQWIVHLGMTGRLQVCDPQTELLKHTHAVLKLASGRELRFVDPRRFGRLSVAQAGDFEAGGFEPLEVELDRFGVNDRGDSHDLHRYARDEAECVRRCCPTRHRALLRQRPDGHNGHCLTRE